MQWFHRSGLLCALVWITSCGGGADSPPESSRSVSSSSIDSASSSDSSSSILSSSSSDDSSSSTENSSPNSSPAPSSSSSQSSLSSSSDSSSSETSQPDSSSSVAQSSSLSSSNSDLFATYIEANIIQADCSLCHVDNGVSGNTRIVFSRGDNLADQNRQVLLSFLTTVTDGDQLLLNKIRGGESHGGGLRFTSDSEQYQAVAEYISAELGTSSSASSSASGFNKLTLESEAETLRRARILLTGLAPNDAEMAAVEGDANALRAAIRTSMTGAGFHEFLLRAANDRLLTDAFLNGQSLDVMDANAPRYPVLADRRVQAYGTDQNAITEFHQWQQGLTYGISRAPLELIAYVVENDLPYTEVLTADYTMVNPYSALIYNATVGFMDESDATEFTPAQNRGQIVLDSFYDGEYVQDLGSVIYSHGDFIDYPHAGILNEPAYLNRYPTTDTNRNRARARWTYYHFLDVDIEKSAPRTNDPDALADTDNPTMKNPNCTVCHQLMDPVAGAFQNYGDEGWYLTSWGGQDSLPDTYKWADDSPYQQGDTWYRDMRTPGFGDDHIADSRNSLQWLAQNIVSDNRFAQATVKFWWSSIMSEPLRIAPENSADQHYQADLLGYETQQALIQSLATQFQTGFNGGAPYNLKDLLVEMVMSHWFRANGTETPLTDEEVQQLQGVGTARLLTPEELEAKTRSLLGLAWGERFDAEWTLDGHWSMLQDDFRIYYGGIDAVGITERAEALNSLMSNVALAHAVGVSCPTVMFDFNRAEDQRILFKHVDRYTTPTLQDQSQLSVIGTSEATRVDQTFTLNLASGEQMLRLSFDNPYWDNISHESLILVIHEVRVEDAQGTPLIDFLGQDLLSISGASVSTNESGDATGNAYWDGDTNSLTGWQLWQGYIEVPVTLASAGEVTVTVNASKRNLLERDLMMSASVNLTLGENSRGEQLLRQQLQYFHRHLLGEWLDTDDPEIDASYNLLVELWQERQARGFPRNAIAWGEETCEIPIDNWWEEDHSSEFSDPQFMQGTWMSMMVYFLTDYRFLHE